MLSLYQNLQSPSYHLCESKRNYIPITERHIQALWFEQKYFKNLCTIIGEKIEVISPGIWNTETGPDFLKAHVKVADREYIGDIEIHLNEEGWYQHRHHEDDRYNNVILHISLWQPKTFKILLKKTQEPLIQVCLEKFLTVPIARLLHLIDIDLYPYKKCLESGKCSHSLFKNLSHKKAASLFTSASYWRLEQKKHYLQSRILLESHQLAGGLSMALGYKYNAEAFLELFLFLLDYRDLPFGELLSISLGCCGFFDKHVPKNWLKSDYYQHLKILWEAKRSDILHQTCIRVDHVRPFNHPVRRLAYLTKLLQDPTMELLWAAISQSWKDYISSFPDNSKARSILKERIFNLIPSYQDDYWSYHYTFEAEARKESLSLIGEDLKAEILINAILPLLYHEIKKQGDAKPWHAFQAFYQILKPAGVGKSEYLIQRFFVGTPHKNILNTRQMEQGAYQLHKDFCMHFEASCEGCPFVERYQYLAN